MKKPLPLLLALLFLTSCLPRVQTTTPTPIDLLNTDWADRSIFKNGLNRPYQDMLNKLPGASVYHLEFKIADDLYHITGTEEVQYTNAEDIALNEVRIRLFSNILGGEMHIAEVDVDGNKVIPNYSLNDSLLTVPFQRPLEPRQSTILKMDFAVTVPQNVDLNYGVQAYFDDVLALAHAYPMIAVYDDEGWNAEIPPQSGDVTYADMSFFVVKITAPENLVLVATGREVQRKAKEGKQVVTYAAGPVRDFYLAASPEYEVFKKTVDGVELRFYARDYLEGGANAALDIAGRAMEDYGARYAPYPYTEFDMVSTPTLALGIEYPGMIAITDWIIKPGDNYLEATVAHEVGHQWFYNLVGNDQLDEPWLDESLTQFATLEYFTDEYGTQAADGFKQDLTNRWAFIGNEPLPVGMPVAFYTEEQYSGIVYGRGALFFEALKKEMGEAKFNTFMKNYVKDNSWGIATTDKLKIEAENQCACDLTPLFEEWVYK